MRRDHEVLEIMAKIKEDPIYINIKCKFCGTTQKTTKHDGEEVCETKECGKTINVTEGWNYAKGDWG